MLIMTVLCINTIFACYNKGLGKNSYNYGKEAKISEKFRWILVAKTSNILISETK